MSSAGSGAGIYNTTRQVGAVLGSAAIATLMASRIAANLPAAGAAGGGGADVATLPPFLHAGFASAMGQAMYLPAAVLLVGFVATAAFAVPRHLAARRAAAAAQPAPAAA
jgi:hypothetical protein